MQETALPMPTFTPLQRNFALGCESHLRLRVHHKIPVPDEIVVESMRAAVNAVAEYAALHGLRMQRWHELGTQRYMETVYLVDDLLALKCDLPQDDPLSLIFRTTMLFTAAPLLREANKRRTVDERRVHRKDAARKEATVNIRAYKILQQHFETGIRIGHLAMLLYDLSAQAKPRSKFYTRTQGILQYLQSISRAKTVGRGLWTWKRTPEEEVELARLRAESGIDEPDGPPPQPGDPPVPGLVRFGTPQPPVVRDFGPPVTVTLEGPEEIPEEDDS
jgi:hypothetical protein